MTLVRYKLADGTVVKTLAEAQESGQNYETMFVAVRDDYPIAEED